MKNFKKLTALMAAFIFAFAFAIAKPQKVQAETDGDWEFTTSDNTATITGYTGSGGAVTIPEKVSNSTDDYTVVAIGNNAFKGCTSLTSITIPDSVTSIGNYAFKGCTSLTSITIPDSVTSIGEQAFVGCTGLTSITIPKSVTSIWNYAFDNCTSLTEINVDTGNTKFSSDNGVLYDKDKTELIICPSRKTSVTIPNTVTSIGKYAFGGCTGLTSIEIPNSVESIGDFAFYGCTGLESIEIPNSVTSIGWWAFKDCTSLTSVTIPNTVTSIEDDAFKNCTSLTSITFDGTEEQWTKAKDGRDIGYDGEMIFREYTSILSQELEYTKGSGKDLEIRFIRTTNNAATFDYFDKDAADAVQIDETPLEASNYTATNGSLKLTVKAPYLEGLSEGNHSLQVNFKDGGTAYADFTIVGAGNNGGENGGNGGNQPNNQGGGDTAQTGTTTGTTEAKTGNNPKTGDSNAMGLFIALAVLSIGGVVVVSKTAKEQTSR